MLLPYNLKRILCLPFKFTVIAECTKGFFCIWLVSYCTWLSWHVRLSGESMSESISNVVKLFQGAKDGDARSLSLLKLHEGYVYDAPAVLDPSKCEDVNEIRDAVSEFAYLVASFKKLGLEHCEKKSRVALSYMLHVLESASGRRARAVKSLDGEGIAEECLEVVKDLSETSEMLVKINEMEGRRLKTLKTLKEWRRKSVLVNDGSKDSKETEEEQSDDESHDDEGESDEEEDEDSSTDDETGEDPQVTKPKPTTHHVNRKCLVKTGCAGYCGPNLRRHLVQVHANKHHIRENNVDRYFAMGLHYKRKRGPRRTDKKGKSVKGRWKRWCPEPFCTYLGAYLPEHLQNKHRMKQSSATYRTALKIARRFRGAKEELDLMPPPEPPIVEIAEAPASRLPSGDDDSPSSSVIKRYTPKSKDTSVAFR